MSLLTSENLHCTPNCCAQYWNYNYCTTIIDGEQAWRERDYDRSMGYNNYRGGRGGRSYRGRGRGGRGRSGSFRHRQDQEYQNYAGTDYIPVRYVFYAGAQVITARITSISVTMMLLFGNLSDEFDGDQMKVELMAKLVYLLSGTFPRQLHRNVCFLLFQMLKYEQPDPTYMMSHCLGTFYYNNYMNLDTSTLKEYIRKQMWVLISVLSGMYLI